jgi:hypothetical protein
VLASWQVRLIEPKAQRKTSKTSASHHGNQHKILPQNHAFNAPEWGMQPRMGGNARDGTRIDA